MRNAVIVDAVRTASGKGKPGGALSGTHPVELLSAVLTALAERTGVDPARIDDVITGCVAQVGEQSLNIGRQGVLAAGWPVSVPATTIDRQCGSSQQAAHFAAQGVIAGAYDIVVAGGVESMSRVPMGTAGIGPGSVRPVGRASGSPPGLVAQGILGRTDRRQVGSDPRRARRVLGPLAPARRARQPRPGDFADEIVPVTVTGADGSERTAHGRRDHPGDRPPPEGWPKLPPSFATEAMAAAVPADRLAHHGRATPRR